ncbi:AAA family ATPase [Brevibacterium sp. BRM-1]|uniref:AAA family ATPase n=1 Tax=Brevibacterium sp. BRM-1 TaxID=2999062 RepID=UPI0022832D91|nr:AAA family ATPase [Brevibacterium sp. BRM-1]WAL39573.1 AAA family ATPase [Brevibacterium sp. BRM-1]
MRIPRVTPASTITPRKMRWLVEDQFPLNTLSTCGGKGGEGKSTLVLDVAARGSRGELHGDVQGPVNTLIVSVEDDWQTTVVPRLMAAGANLDRILKFDVETYVEDTGESFETKAVLPIDVTQLREAIIEHDVRLVIFDPAASFIDGDPNKVIDVRRAFEPISKLAQDLDLAVILIAHFGKGTGSVGDKLSGSHAWRDLTRSYWAFATDDETGKHYMTQEKSNYSKTKGTYEFELTGVPVPISGETVEVVAIGNITPSEVDVAEIINRPVADGDDDVSECGEWLLSYLDREPFEFARADIVKAGRAEGFSEATLKRSKKRLGVAHRRTKTVPTTTVWEHPSISGNQVAHDREPTEPTDTKTHVSAGQPSQLTVSSRSVERANCEPTGLTRENTPPNASQLSQLKHEDPDEPTDIFGKAADPYEAAQDTNGNVGCSLCGKNTKWRTARDNDGHCLNCAKTHKESA